MGKTVYFDINVFGHIMGSGNGPVSRKQIEILEQLLKNGKLSIILSYLNLDEAIAAAKDSPQKATELVSIIFKYADDNKIVRELPNLLRKDIERWAIRKRRSPFAQDPKLKRALEDLKNGKWDTKELQETAGETDQQKKDNATAIIQGFENAKAEVGAEFNRKTLIHASFENFWKSSVNDYLNILLESAEKHKRLSDQTRTTIRKRGELRLLKIPSVLVGVGYEISYIYAKTYEAQPGEVKARRDINYDHHHAMLATAADIFVTHDKTLTRILKRIPNLPYEVLSLSELCSRFASE
jgi:hypothetical protein